MAKRQCQGKTKAGNACKAPPLTTSDYCSAHNPLAPADARFGSPEQAAVAGAKGGAAGRQPRAVDVLRERIEQNIDAVIGPLFDALDADRGIVVGAGDGASVEFVTDWTVRLAAVRELLDRGYGKPKQALEHSGPEGTPLDVNVRFDEKQRKALSDVLRGRPATRGE